MLTTMIHEPQVSIVMTAITRRGVAPPPSGKFVLSGTSELQFGRTRSNIRKEVQMFPFECLEYINPCVSSLHFGVIPLSGVIRNGLPSMKVEKFKKFMNKTGLKGCKWSSLTAPGTETHQNHQHWKLEEFPFSHY